MWSSDARRARGRSTTDGSIQISRSPFCGDFRLVGDRTQREGGGYRLAASPCCLAG